ncbi:TPA: helix-turn-helix transcriptional regulator [Pseudomonas aeruginosa]|nr:helix-turn-helix transcriptional regulator [Pseudomonas aeruginosa]
MRDTERSVEYGVYGAHTVGLSQDALAHVCMMDRSYVGRIERGEVNLTIEKLYRIAYQLDCQPHTLLPYISR